MLLFGMRLERYAKSVRKILRHGTILRKSVKLVMKQSLSGTRL